MVEYPNKYEADVQCVPVPNAIDLSEVNVRQHDCFRNAFQVALKNIDVIVIEGIILLVSPENGGRGVAHVWNKYKGDHFDITIEQLLSDVDGVQRVVYFPAYEYTAAELDSKHLYIKQESLDTAKSLTEYLAQKSKSNNNK